jgi:hypothetical protein
LPGAEEAMTRVETAQVHGFRPEVAPWYGCNGNTCKSHCWYFNRIVPRMAANHLIKCPKCKTGEPHLHLEIANSMVYKYKKPRCYSGHMGEIADLSEYEIETIRRMINRPEVKKAGHIYQIFTHRPMEFYSKYPDWPDHVWAMGTFTEGKIEFPANLKAGQIVAYCEPVLGEFEIACDNITWVVIGLVTKFTQTEEEWDRQIKIANEKLVYHYSCREIPIFLKNHPRWPFNLTTVKQWPNPLPLDYPKRSEPCRQSSLKSKP